MIKPGWLKVGFKPACCLPKGITVAPVVNSLKISQLPSDLLINLNVSP